MKRNEQERFNTLKKVYETILTISESGRQPLRQIEVCTLCDLPYQEESKHGDHCRALWDIVKEINERPEFDHIIISEDYTYRTATRKEVIEYTDKQISKALKILKRRSDILHKLSMDGQMDIINDLKIAEAVINHKEEI